MQIGTNNKSTTNLLLDQQLYGSIHSLPRELLPFFIIGAVESQNIHQKI